jgi:hypothetical protein
MLPATEVGGSETVCQTISAIIKRSSDRSRIHSEPYYGIYIRYFVHIYALTFQSFNFRARSVLRACDDGRAGRKRASERSLPRPFCRVGGNVSHESHKGRGEHVRLERDGARQAERALWLCALLGRSEWGERQPKAWQPHLVAFYVASALIPGRLRTSAPRRRPGARRVSARAQEAKWRPAGRLMLRLPPLPDRAPPPQPRAAARTKTRRRG